MHTHDGTPTNALFWYTKALIRILQSDAAYVVVAFDSGGDTFRSEIDENYKAHRDGMPSDLGEQIELIFQVTDLLGVPSLAVPWYEADDIIGTLTKQYEKSMDKIQIVSSDKDLFQLIDGTTVVYDAMKFQEYGRAWAKEKFGVEPEQIIDYLALIGDTSDNIPGVRGIGPKGAIKLLEEYGTLANILAHRDELTPKLQSLLTEGEESAKMSQKLATIHTDVPLEVDILAQARMSAGVDFSPELIDFLKSHEFLSLIPSHLRQTDPDFEMKWKPLDAKTIWEILAKIQSDTPYSFFLTDENLLTFAIAFSEKEVYSWDRNTPGAMKFLHTIIQYPYKMTTYDWKRSVRAILMADQVQAELGPFV